MHKLKWDIYFQKSPKKRKIKLSWAVKYVFSHSEKTIKESRTENLVYSQIFRLGLLKNRKKFFGKAFMLNLESVLLRNPVFS